MGLAEVSDILWRERELLDVLLFKLEEEQLLLAAGKVRWVARATREVELVLEQLRLTELTRAVEVEAVGAELGIGSNPSLVQLAKSAPEPWAGIFQAHREAFLASTAEISAMAESNREFVTTAYNASREALLSLGGNETQGYTSTGRRTDETPRQRLLDEVI